MCNVCQYLYIDSSNGNLQQNVCCLDGLSCECQAERPKRQRVARVFFNATCVFYHIPAQIKFDSIKFSGHKRLYRRFILTMHKVDCVEKLLIG